VTSAEAPLALRWELARKALHLLWAIVPVTYRFGATRSVLVTGLAIAAVIALGVEIGRSRSMAFDAVFQRSTGALLRHHERSRWSGATWLLLSFLVCVLLFDRPTAIGAMWAVAAGDAAAAIVGRTLGRHHLGSSAKTIEGSIACAIVTAVGAFTIAQLPLIPSIGAGLAAALAEWPAGPLDDNMRIGLAVGGGILLCRMAFS